MTSQELLRKASLYSHNAVQTIGRLQCLDMRRLHAPNLLHWGALPTAPNQYKYQNIFRRKPNSRKSLRSYGRLEG